MTSLQQQIEEIEAAEFVPVADLIEWAAWWEANGEYLEMDEPTARALAMNCELVVGGGAAPLFRIGFVD
jgi:hypothetical protein